MILKKNNAHLIRFKACGNLVFHVIKLQLETFVVLLIITYKIPRRLSKKFLPNISNPTLLVVTIAETLHHLHGYHTRRIRKQDDFDQIAPLYYRPPLQT